MAPRRRLEPSVPASGDLPTGTVTFLFTDIEGSTRLVQALGDGYPALLAEHARLIRTALAAQDGREVNTEGDAFFAVFTSALAAVSAAAEIQRAIAAAPALGGLRVRIGVHTGVGLLGGDDYVGLDVHRAARVGAVAHGGQVLLSGASARLVDGSLPVGLALRELGTFRLKGLDRAEALAELRIEGLPGDFPPPRATDVRDALPVVPTSFVGRSAELEALAPLVAPGRVLTLVGPGGAGKTRLALELVRRIVARFPDGAWFADLAGLGRGASVADSLASALGVRTDATTPALTAAGDQLHGRDAIVVLDNCEHVLDDAARVAEAVLAAAPTIALVATSREALGVAAETLFRVPTLSLPTGDRPDDLAASDAASLFLQRAAAVAPSLELDGVMAAAIARIVRRLDGIPLAIELAAARTDVLSPAEIAARLEDRLGLLTTGRRGAQPRQRTLRGSIEWSHDLLDPAERTLFRRLAVFAGGCTLAACETVTADVPPDARDLPREAILDSLARLVTKSLLVAERGPTTRYQMLETIREYADERLSAAAEDDDLAWRHLRWCAALAAEAAPHLVASGQREWFDRLTAEHDNVRAAMAFGADRDAPEVVAIIEDLYWFWGVRGFAREGRAWAQAALRRPASAQTPRSRQGLLLAEGSLAWIVGDLEPAAAALRESAALATEADDRRGAVSALTLLAHTQVFAGDPSSARATLGDAIPMARELDDPFLLARSLGTLADVARHDGTAAERSATAAEALACFRAVGMEEGIGFNLLYGASGLMESDPAEARARILDALGRFQRVDVPAGVYSGLVALADLGRPPAYAVAQVIGGLAVVTERTGFRGAPVDREALARLRARAETDLGEARFEQLVQAGRERSTADLVALAGMTAT